ncbi:FecR family protein [Brevundimonas sp.]|uniref:FecR family protein n=1 Tax=Brevundimonas sp. TaxID=1871086 RepID=UPI003F726F08
MNSFTDIDEQARGWFVRLNGPDAPEADWLAFQDWIEADDAHRLAYDRVEALWVALEDVPASALPANEDLPRPRRQASRPGWLLPGVGIAAAVLLAVGVWPMLNGGDLQTYRTTSAPQTVRLEDGSTVYLNRHSEMRVRMRPGRREVSLTDGEAAFDVTHDTRRPFVIAADDHSVEVLGTAFNVVNHDGRFSVSVERGVVGVTPANSRTPLRLKAGQRVDQVSNAAAVLSTVDPATASAWRDGVLVYRRASLGEVGDDLSRYLDKPVNVSQSARELRFTGVLRVGDEKIMLEQLRELVPVEVSRSPEGVELTRRGGT